MISTRAALSRRWPLMPTSGSRRWRPYRRSSSRSSRGAERVTRVPVSMASIMSPSCHGGDDRDLIALVDWGRESADEADVLVVQVIRHERVRRPLVIDQASREGWESAREVRYGFADGRAVGWDGAMSVGEARENTWERYADGHGSCPRGARRGEWGQETFDESGAASPWLRCSTSAANDRSCG